MSLDTEHTRVAHLLRRAGFGASEAELDQYTALGFQGALDRLLTPEQVDDSAADQPIPINMDPTNRDTRRQIEPAKVWWFDRMLATQRPLREKMTLFWHTHFATANSKVANAPLMLNQIQLFGDAGLGSFEALLRQVTRDPAMLIWLDNRQNRKGAPNENYAREVMELFTVGIGNYSEQDVKEGARAFTGHTLDRDLQYTFNRNQHDAGAKTFMGQTGAFDADDVLGILVGHPATARFISTKLFRFFVHDNPEPASIDRLANTFTTSGFDVRSVLRDLFSGPEFLSATAYHAQIKQPVDFAIGSLKALNVQNPGPDVVQTLRRMGQDLLNPPDVSGWKGGPAWINSSTLFERFNFAEKLTMAAAPGRPYFTDIGGQLSAHAASAPDAWVDYYVNLLVDGDITPQARSELLAYLGDNPDLDLKARGLVHLVMAVPTYQLA
jgi:uncharacterized protein (DUF1800 family)